jgi:hypothetical protein
MIASAVQWEEQSVKMMKALIAKGANLNAPDKQGPDGRGLGGRSRYIDRAKLLLASGTKIRDRPAFLKRAQNYTLWRVIAGGGVSARRRS